MAVGGSPICYRMSINVEYPLSIEDKIHFWRNQLVMPAHVIRSTETKTMKLAYVAHNMEIGKHLISSFIEEASAISGNHQYVLSTDKETTDAVAHLVGQVLQHDGRWTVKFTSPYWYMLHTTEYGKPCGCDMVIYGDIPFLQEEITIKMGLPKRVDLNTMQFWRHALKLPIEIDTEFLYPGTTVLTYHLPNEETCRQLVSNFLKETTLYTICHDGCNFRFVIQQPKHFEAPYRFQNLDAWTFRVIGGQKTNVFIYFRTNDVSAREIQFAK